MHPQKSRIPVSKPRRLLSCRGGATWSVLAVTLLAGSVKAQEESNGKQGGGATDKGSCSGSQSDGDLGAGAGMIGAGSYVRFNSAQTRLVNLDWKVEQQLQSSINYLGIPVAMDSYGTVDSVGNLLFTIDLIDPPSINGFRVDLALHYRSNRQAASIEAFGGAVLSATTDLSQDWNLSIADRITEVSGDLNYTSGSGTFSKATPVSAPPGVTGAFWAMERGNSVFRKHTYNGVEVIDRHRSDGSVMRSELISGEWRPKVFLDPFDNEYTYEYDTNGSLIKLTDPRGMETRFTWTTSPTTLVVEHAVGGVVESSLTETMELTNGQVTKYTGPSTTYVELAGTGIYDLTAPVSVPISYTIAYWPTSQYSSPQPLLKEVRDTRFPGTGQGTLSCTYVVDNSMSTGPRYRVLEQTDMHAGTHEFTYARNGGGQLITKYADPLGNEYQFTHDASGYPLQYAITPSSTGGRPRFDAGDTAEPASLSWGMSYSGCGCGNIESITYPTGRNYSMQYDGNGKRTELTTLSPTGVGNVTHQWAYLGLEYGCRLDHYTPPAGNASFTFSYSWTARAQGIWGYKPTQVTVISSAIGLVGGGTQVLTTTQTLDAQGRPVATQNPDGTYTDYVYKASGAGAGLLLRIERREIVPLGKKEAIFDQDDFGRVSSIMVGTAGNYAETEFTFDVLGRTLTESSDPGNGLPPMVTTLHRDQFENVAVVERSNLDYDGQPPQFADGTGVGARATIRDDYVFWFDRATDTYVDRRALPEAASLASPTTGANPWMVHYQADYDDGGRVVSMTAPNGALTSYIWDGYGQLYRSIGDAGTGGINQDLGRYYFDNDLVLEERRNPVKTGGAVVLASTTYSRNHSGMGYVNAVTLPDGILQLRNFDSMGRTIQQEMYGASGPRRLFSEVVYDELGRVKSGKEWLLDASGVVSGAPAQTDYLYDIRSNIVEVTAPLGRQAFRTYDAYGRLQTAHDNVSTTATDWNEVELAYLPGRDLVTSVVSKVFEEADNATPPTGTRKEYRTEFEHDLLGRVVLTRKVGLVGGAATPLVSTFRYNSLGSIVFTQEPQQQGTTDQYTQGTFDAVGRWVQLLKSTGPGANDRILLRSDYLDWQSGSTITEVSRFDGRGFVTRSEFDALYRLQNHYRPGYTSGQAHKTIVQYDGGSMVDRVVDGNGSEILYSRDIVGRVLQRNVTPGFYVSPNATREVFGFDDIGRLDSIATDAYGTSTRIVQVDFAHDSLNRLLQESFQYYGTGATPFDVTSDYTYSGSQPIGDPSFRRGLTYPGGFQVDTVPDQVGRLEEVKLTPAGSSQFTLAKYRYASSSVFQRELWLGSATSVTTETSFDDQGRLASLYHKQAGSTVESYQYTWNDANDLIRKRRDYDDGSASLATAGELFEYDGYHRLVGAKQGVPSGQANGDYSSATSFSKEVLYGLDPGQNRTSVVTNFPGGFSTATAYATEANSSRYTAAEGVSPLYDSEGNLVFDGVKYYKYDFRNRLSEVYGVYQTGSTSSAMASGGATGTELTSRQARRVELRNLETGRSELRGRAQQGLINWARGLRRNSPQRVSGPTTATGEAAAGDSNANATFELVLETIYGYDPFNRRVLRIGLMEDKDLRYAYDGWRELEEIVLDGSTVIERNASVWGHGVGELLSYQRLLPGGRQDYYPLLDEQGSVVRLLNSAAGTTERLEYDQYGRSRFYYGGTGAAQPISMVGNPWTYATGRLDTETGLLYLRNRYVDPKFGRFCTVDPAGDWTEDSSYGNPYAYVGNSASMLTDVMGLLVDGQGQGQQGGQGGQGQGGQGQGQGGQGQGQGGQGQGQGGQGQGQGGQGQGQGGQGQGQAGLGIGFIASRPISGTSVTGLTGIGGGGTTGGTVAGQLAKLGRAAAAAGPGVAIWAAPWLLFYFHAENFRQSLDRMQPPGGGGGGGPAPGSLGMALLEIGPGPSPGLPQPPIPPVVPEPAPTYPTLEPLPLDEQQQVPANPFKRYCVEQFLSDIAQCSGLKDPMARALCERMARDAFEKCKKNAPLPGPPHQMVGSVAIDKLAAGTGQSSIGTCR